MFNLFQSNDENSPARLMFLTVLLISSVLFYRHMSIKWSNLARSQPWIIMDIKGTSLTRVEKQMLSHPYVAGVVLGMQKEYGHPEIGGKQYESPEVVRSLIAEIKAINPKLMVTIDHEGSRIISIKGVPEEPYIPELLHDYPEEEHEVQARALGNRVGSLLHDLGVDVVFGPVVDLAYGQIIRRAISTNPGQVVKVARAYIEGIQSNGVQTVLKHFPGLGGVESDTHQARSIAKRDYKEGLAVFNQLKDTNSWVMKGHAIYEEQDPLQASISPYWAVKAKDFITIADDISMKGLTQPFEEKLKISKKLNTYTIVMHSQPELYNYLQKHNELKKLK